MMGFGHGPMGGRSFLKKALSKKVYVAVLQSLTTQARTGYEVMQAVSGQLPPWFHLGPERVYPVLQLQVDRGHATLQTEEGQTRYAVTEAGRTYLADREADGEGDPFAGFPFQGGSPEDWAQHKRQFKEMVHALRHGFWNQGRPGGRRDEAPQSRDA